MLLLIAAALATTAALAFRYEEHNLHAQPAQPAPARHGAAAPELRAPASAIYARLPRFAAEQSPKQRLSAPTAQVARQRHRYPVDMNR